ncbi:MAG: hypothetical protein P9L96_05635 [Candidatus Gygaella obscura]|nr:hypothetical protein [Candidatus Gygaella obscura]
MKKIFLGLVGLIFLYSINLFASEQQAVELTVYNQNFALVKDKRSLELKKGINDIRFSDVASYIEPESVHFKSLTDPLGCLIQEQNYEYDLVSADKLLKKYIDNSIKLLTENGKLYEGKLLSYDGNNIVIVDSTGINMVTRKDNIINIAFPELPEGLITKPTLMWQIKNRKSGKHLIEVSYLTKNIRWNADYVVVVDKLDKKIDLSGWVTIDNRSGATYKDARLKLIAGDVNRVQENFIGGSVQKSFAAREMVDDEQFSEKAFFEYHMYTLERSTTVKNNQTKQVSLLSAESVPVQKLFVYDPVDYYGWRWFDYDNSSSKKQKIKVKLEFKNSKKDNLGMPLPKGKVKVYKKDTDESLQFIGENMIDHTPKDEKIRLYLGDAFDVVGERKKMNYREDHKARWSEETFEISLRNHKDTDIVVNVIEHLWRYTNWKIISKTHEFEKKDAQTIQFNVPVKKDSEVKLEYVVRYRW